MIGEFVLIPLLFVLILFLILSRNRDYNSPLLTEFSFSNDKFSDYGASNTSSRRSDSRRSSSFKERMVLPDTAVGQVEDVSRVVSAVYSISDVESDQEPAEAPAID